MYSRPRPDKALIIVGLTCLTALWVVILASHGGEGLLRSAEAEGVGGASLETETVVLEPASPSGRGWREHVVSDGDTLSRMEALYGCTVADISLVNGIRSLDTLVPGQKLVIPVGGDLSAAREEARLRQAVLETKRNFPPRVAFSVYEVQPGDSAWSIAGKFDLDVNTVLGCNPKTLSGRIHPGIEVRIPNQDGILVKVSRGNTLASIARRYEVVESALASANGIAEPVLEAGTLLFVPGGKLIEDEDSAQGSVRKKSAKPASKESRFHWPLAGRVNSSYGWRRDPFTGGRDFHTGIDIGAPVGSPVRSATAGRVAFAGWMGGYGKSVVVEKGGLMIIYAHCSKLKVRPGQSVKKGQTVALVGSTGRSTGPHLHFEIRLNGRAVNPSRYYR